MNPDLILFEKYRPLKFEDLVCSEKEIILGNINNPKKIQSMLFYGSPGNGKTSTGKIIAEMLGCDTLVINGSKENGIAVIREKVDEFVSLKSFNKETIRLVFINESERMSPEAQCALKDVMDEYSSNAFFIFTTNDIYKIEEAIQSRCLKISFDNPKKEDIFNRLKFISLSEQLSFTDKELELIIDVYYPDMRSMISSLSVGKVLKQNLSEIFNKFKNAIIGKNVDYVIETINNNLIDIDLFVNWFFIYLFSNWKKLDKNVDSSRRKAKNIGKIIAEIQKCKKLNLNIKHIAIPYMLEIMDCFGEQ